MGEKDGTFFVREPRKVAILGKRAGILRRERTREAYRAARLPRGYWPEPAAWEGEGVVEGVVAGGVGAVAGG